MVNSWRLCDTAQCDVLASPGSLLCMYHTIQINTAKEETTIERDNCPLKGCRKPRVAGSDHCHTHQQFFGHEAEKKETTGENSQKALRYNSGKLRLNLLPWEWQKWLTELLMYGAKKHTTETRSGDHNWKSSLNTDDHNSFVADRKESLKRHLLQYDSGELTDEESGIQHMVMIAWNALVIAWYDNYRKDEIDAT